jgi:hypothetical protein
MLEGYSVTQIARRVENVRPIEDMVMGLCTIQASGDRNCLVAMLRNTHGDHELRVWSTDNQVRSLGRFEGTIRHPYNNTSYVKPKLICSGQWIGMWHSGELGAEILLWRIDEQGLKIA